MRIRNIFLLILFISFSKALTFEETQSISKDVKKIVQYEENISRAYENYILDEYKIPALSDLNLPILGIAEENKDDIFTISISFNEITLNDDYTTKLSYALKEDLKDSTDADKKRIKALYESNTYRKRTYVRNNQVYFRLEDDFAKHLYDLLKNTDDKEIADCPEYEDFNEHIISPAINCKMNNHIYIGVGKIQKKNEGIDYYTFSDVLIAYRIDMFKTGPIVITNDTLKHTEDEFDSIPVGALLFDTDGLKYIKEINGIKEWVN
jgi:hypothetical protein